MNQIRNSSRPQATAGDAAPRIHRRGFAFDFALRIAAGFALCIQVAAGAAALSALTPSVALADDAFPARPLRWIVPYAAGGGSDFLARTIGEQLSKDIGQAVVIENKPGANTAIGAVELVRAPADGYTVLSADNGTMTFNPLLYRKLTYDPKRDLRPVTLMGRFPMILVVGPEVKAKDAKAFLAEMRDNGRDASFASPGAGSPHHLAMEMLLVNQKLPMIHVPYRGAAPALADVAGGQVPAMMVDLAAGAGFIKGGKVRPLAVANAKRLPQLPDVPTFAELGIEGVEAAALVGLVTHAKATDEVVKSLNQRVVAAIRNADVSRRMTEFGVEPVGSSSEDYASLLKSESERWEKIIREKDIRLD